MNLLADCPEWAAHSKVLFLAGCIARHRAATGSAQSQWPYGTAQKRLILDAVDVVKATGKTDFTKGCQSSGNEYLDELARKVA